MNENTQLLRDILSTLREIRDSLRTGGGPTGASPSSSTGTQSGKGEKVASDRELDSEWGNPVVRSDPKDWVGPSFKSCNYSECPPDFLDMLAELLDWMADKDEEQGKKTADKPGRPGRPTAPYKRSDASRARGWAARIRNGWQPKEPAERKADEPSGDYGGAGAVDDIPFLTGDATLIGERWWRWS